MSIGTGDVGETDVPLVVDLNGTLLRSDLAIETLFAFLGAGSLQVLDLLQYLVRGKAALQARIASAANIDPSHLPYDERALALIQAARAAGRRVFLASASNERHVAEVARHLGIFDGWFASTGDVNLSPSAKAALLTETFGAKGFDYVGDAKADLAVWTVARKCIAVHPAASTRAALLHLDPDATIIDPPEGRLRAWFKLLRVHQWAKNGLVVVPLLTSHRIDVGSLFAGLFAFVAFCLAASAVYLINDLVDLNADRRHQSKKLRPLAAGTVPIRQALALAIILLAAAMVVAMAVSPDFAFILFIYLVLTTAYTFVLKRKMIADVLTLAALYTVRVIGGAVAISVPISEWLLAFSMFIFTALALIKRYVELAGRVDAGLPDLASRDYRNSDLSLIAMLGCAAAFNAVTVFALYISSDAVRLLYRNPQVLWLACPVMMYWLGRMILTAHRRLMDDDPIIFALTDRNTLLSLALIGIIIVVAI